MRAIMETLQVFISVVVGLVGLIVTLLAPLIWSIAQRLRTVETNQKNLTLLLEKMETHLEKRLERVESRIHHLELANERNRRTAGTREDDQD